MADHINKALFSARLNEALDEAGAPPYGRGRQQWLAERMGVTSSAVNYWCNGDTVPSLNKLVALSQLFAKPLTYFLDDTSRAARTPPGDIDLQHLANALVQVDRALSHLGIEDCPSDQRAKLAVELYRLSAKSGAPLSDDRAADVIEFATRMTNTGG